MNEKLKTLVRLAQFLQEEIKQVSYDSTLNPNACRLVREASLDAITLYRKIEEALWNTKMQPKPPCKVGDKITLVRMGPDPNPVTSGSTGKVISVQHWSGVEWNIGVKWDNGRTLNLVYPIDQFIVK
jgi:hypothetical protein